MGDEKDDGIKTMKIMCHIDAHDGRELTFGEEVEPGKMNDFFDRIKQALYYVFIVNTVSRCVVTIDPSERLVNKIQVIKIIREYTGLGLKESKDIAECSSPTYVRGALAWFETHNSADAFVRALQQAGVLTVRISMVDHKDDGKLAVAIANNKISKGAEKA